VKSVTFWDIIQGNPLEIHQHFGGTSVNFHWTIWHHIQEASILFVLTLSCLKHLKVSHTSFQASSAISWTADELFDVNATEHVYTASVLS
jgi:hypothetical protein